mmetsp:Transcript_67593/g.197827  ORF Transcript_67593/g.197827 Transcript_67593/m.197827 type:complete len:232 (+) Transcript_67593:101-796(+)
MAGVLTMEALGPPKEEFIDDLGMVPSPTPPSVCPTEMSTISTALGACAEQLSDSSSEADSDMPVPPDVGAQCSQWRKIGERLARAFSRLASADLDDDGGEEDFNFGSYEQDSDSDFGEGEEESAHGHFGALLGPQAARSPCSEQSADASPNPCHALLEHYEVFGAPSGSWRRRAPPLHQIQSTSSEEDACDECEAAAGKRQTSRFWNCDRHSLSHRLSRVLGEMRAAEDDA